VVRQVSRGENWDPINRFNTDTFVYLSQAMISISSIPCRGRCVYIELTREKLVPFVDIGRIVEHQCFYFLCKILVKLKHNSMIHRYDRTYLLYVIKSETTVPVI